MATKAKTSKTASTVQRQRALQQRIDRKDAGKPATPARPKPVQTSARRQPSGPMPRQHLAKPGREADMNPAPRFDAPEYFGSGKLAGMVAVVTGADSGIGRSVAVLFAREGADVAILYLNEAEDAAVTAAAVELEGRRALTIAGNVGDAKFCNRAVAKVVKHFGKIDVLVNNAAFQLHARTLEDISDAHLHETLQTNIAGYFYMARAVLPHLQRGACIINTGSKTGLFGSKELIDYSATKGAVHAFTRALASNLLERGIRVNAVAPGPVWTPFNAADRPAKQVSEFGMKSEMGRPAQPEEVAPAYVFLASPITASYINGIVLPVMGGPRG